jgi:hypothetical protein
VTTTLCQFKKSVHLCRPKGVLEGGLRGFPGIYLRFFFAEPDNFLTFAFLLGKNGYRKGSLDSGQINTAQAVLVPSAGFPAESSLKYCKTEKHIMPPSFPRWSDPFRDVGAEQRGPENKNGNGSGHFRKHYTMESLILAQDER